jgi:hypothetical protein
MMSRSVRRVISEFAGSILLRRNRWMAPVVLFKSKNNFGLIPIKSNGLLVRPPLHKAGRRG